MTIRSPMNQTTWPKQNEIKRSWYVFDLEGKTVGRVSTKIAKYLMGKNAPNYTESMDMGNNVILINADKAKFTSVKADYLDIRRYTGYPGGLRKERVKDLMVSNPAAVITHAIKGMLPNNKLKDRFLTRLYVYAGPTHPHEAQQPEKIN